MSLKHLSSRICAAFALITSRQFAGSIALVVGFTAFLSSYSRAVFAEPCNEGVITAETYSAIEIDFFAYLLNGLAHDPAFQPAESKCTITPYAVIDTDPASEQSGSIRCSAPDVDCPALAHHWQEAIS